MLSQTGQVDRDRITREAFVAAGTAIVSKFSVADQRKYYFKLFSGGKDYLTKEDALQMVHVSYMLMVSVSKITYNHDDRDIKVFEGMVTSMFGIEERLNCTELEAWLATNCPNMFSGVHNWVCTVLNGSNLPSEMEARTAHVPQLENFICGQHCLSLGMAWALASVLPNCYTHIAQASQVPGSLSPNQKNPLITSYHLLLSMDGKPLVLRVDEDFDRIYHYDVPCAFHRMELRLEDDWRENPDKQILEWGGVTEFAGWKSDSTGSCCILWYRAWRVVLDAGFLRVCPIQPHFLRRICLATGSMNYLRLVTRYARLVMNDARLVICDARLVICDARLVMRYPRLVMGYPRLVMRYPRLVMGYRDN
nr:hypothetical protein BaRGS_011920 [Batillaria attramentaria]